jgi:hypothetical protein
MIDTMSGQAPLDSFSTGTLAGAGCFRCGSCGFAVALHERDEVPACPHCGGEDFRRSSIFGELEMREPTGGQPLESPDWLADARDAIERDGDYLAYEDDDHVQVLALESGWTRVGRSLAADVRFDDPTVSRRHAMLHRADGVARVLDDRNELTIGRFHLYFLSLAQVGASRAPSLSLPRL